MYGLGSFYVFFKGGLFPHKVLWSSPQSKKYEKS